MITEICNCCAATLAKPSVNVIEIVLQSAEVGIALFGVIAALASLKHARKELRANLEIEKFDKRLVIYLLLNEIKVSFQSEKIKKIDKKKCAPSEIVNKTIEELQEMKNYIKVDLLKTLLSNPLAKQFVPNSEAFIKNEENKRDELIAILKKRMVETRVLWDTNTCESAMSVANFLDFYVKILQSISNLEKPMNGNKETLARRINQIWDDWNSLNMLAQNLFNGEKPILDEFEQSIKL